MKEYNLGVKIISTIFALLIVVLVVYFFSIIPGCSATSSIEEGVTTSFDADTDRFIITSISNDAQGGYCIFVDKETGVNYIFVHNGFRGGLSPLYNSDGQVIVTGVN